MKKCSKTDFMVMAAQFGKFTKKKRKSLNCALEMGELCGML